MKKNCFSMKCLDTHTQTRRNEELGLEVISLANAKMVLAKERDACLQVCDVFYLGVGASY